MRTTVDIPDELLREAKVRAALQGLRLRDLVEKGLRLALAAPVGPERSRRVAFPLHHSQQPGALSKQDVRRAEEQAQLDEDASNAGAV